MNEHRRKRDISWARVARWMGRALGAGVACIVLPATGVAQGNVTGRVTITERPGESTDDLGNVVITLEPAVPARSRLPTRTAQIAMERRRFIPGVVVVSPGSVVEFPNRDGFDHNVFSTEPGTEFDAGQYGRGETYGVSFRRPGVVPIYCNIHSRMVAHVVVTTTPHATQAAADGRFTLGNVPAGIWTLRIWHARTPTLVRELEVPPAGLALDLATLDARGFRFAAHKNKFGQDYKSTGERY